MSRRSVTTISIQVRLRIPPGSNVKQVVDYVKAAISNGKPTHLAMPLTSLDTDSMIVKLVSRDTTYL